MGSLSLVTSELTSPIKETSLQLFLLISPVRRNNFTMFDSPQMQRAGQRPVSWVNIPITRTVNNIMANVVGELRQQPQQSPKRVRWSEELIQVRDISPRHKSSPFRFVTPHRNRSASPSRSSSSSSSSRPSKSSLSSTQLHCSPQMQKVVFRAVNNNNNESNNNNNINNNINYWGSPTKTGSWRLNNNSDSSWRPDRSNLSLNIR